MFGSGNLSRAATACQPRRTSPPGMDGPILRRVNALGARIKALREQRGLLQKQVAEKAGLTASKVSQIESGRMTPSLRTLGRLAEAFGISIPELLEPSAPGESVHI